MLEDSYLDYLFENRKDVILYLPNLTYKEQLEVFEKYEEENGFVFFPDVVGSYNLSRTSDFGGPYIREAGEYITIVDQNTTDNKKPTTIFVGIEESALARMDHIHSTADRPDVLDLEKSDGYRPMNYQTYRDLNQNVEKKTYQRFIDLYTEFQLETMFVIIDDKIYPVIKQSVLLNLEKSINMWKGYTDSASGTVSAGGYVPTLIKQYGADDMLYSEEDYYHIENANLKNVVTKYNK